jgi:hypothetical protein
MLYIMLVEKKIGMAKNLIVSVPPFLTLYAPLHFHLHGTVLFIVI